MEMRIYFPGGSKVYADYKGFTIKTDQSVLSGGDGSAPEPFDLFLASIGTCAGVYVLYFCKQRGIPYEQIELIQKFKYNPEKRLIEEVKIEIRVPKDFPEKYLNAIENSAAHCTVKRHLEAPPKFKIKAKVVD